MILNNLNPDFTKNFIIDYYFEKEQTMKFEVYDVDEGANDDFIGAIEVPLRKIMGG
jgi:Ca2+-dependent lipid-binding protein